MGHQETARFTLEKKVKSQKTGRGCAWLLRFGSMVEEVLIIKVLVEKKLGPYTRHNKENPPMM